MPDREGLPGNVHEPWRGQVRCHFRILLQQQRRCAADLGEAVLKLAALIMDFLVMGLGTHQFGTE